MADITMPQLGETVTEGTITRWAKQVGDRIEEDEVLFEVSTDKVDSEVPSPASGYVAEILVPEGETVDVGARLAVITAEAPGGGGEAAAAPAAPAPDPVQATQEEAAGTPEPDLPKDPAPQPEAAPAAAQAAPPAAAPAAPAAAPSDEGDEGPADTEGLLLSPVVRRLITEHGLDPTSIQGTGAGGRITRADVLARIDGQGGAPAKPAAKAAPAAPAPAAPAAAPAPAPAAAPTPAPAPAAAAAPAPRPAPSPAPAAGADDELVPFSNIRRRTAEHMVRSKATSAHTLVVFEVDYAGVDKVRKAHAAAFREQEGIGLNYLPFIARAVVDALREFPHVNASVGDDTLIVHRRIGLGVAVDLNFEGLIVPVVHDADSKRLRGIAREIADLAGRARGKKLGADDISGGTFTLTNAGGYGTFLTGPVINQPQVAILSTDGVKKKPVVVELPDGTDTIAIHPMGNLCLSWDHRAFDGAYASAFLAKVKEILETRDWEAEL